MHTRQQNKVLLKFILKMIESKDMNDCNEWTSQDEESDAKMSF